MLSVDNPEKAETQLDPPKPTTMRVALKQYFADKQALIDETYNEVDIFWQHLSPQDTDSDQSQVSSFEVLVEKLK